jgi:hypothetical protein
MGKNNTNNTSQEQRNISSMEERVAAIGFTMAMMGRHMNPSKMEAKKDLEPRQNDPFFKKLRSEYN